MDTIQNSMAERVKIDDQRLIGLVKAVEEEVSNLYLKDDKPWVVGFSGGKDSTTLLQLVFRALLRLPKDKLSKKVHVVCSDTLVESPYVIDYIIRTLSNIEKGAKDLKLPLTVNKVVPEWEDTFFVNLIGKGYPAPNRWFRWCTERLKINPTNKFIEEQIESRGSVIILLGSRKAESSSRAQVMANHEIKGDILRKHASLRNAFVYTPIADWANDDVWDYLVNFPSPWGGRNWEIVQLYKEASGGECPLVIDKTTPSCGQSRFGCWVCTVVNVDNSMQGFIDSGVDLDLGPLQNFRNWLKEIRDQEDKREKVRRNLTKGLGPFKMEVRKEMLRRLFQISKQTGIELIKNEELKLIQSYWTQDGGTSNEASLIFNEVFGGGYKMYSDQNLKNMDREIELLENVCLKKTFNSGDIASLIEVEKQLIGKQKRRGLTAKIDEVIKRIAYKEGEDHNAVEEIDI